MVNKTLVKMWFVCVCKHLQTKFAYFLHLCKMKSYIRTSLLVELQLTAGSLSFFVTSLPNQNLRIQKLWVFALVFQCSVCLSLLLTPKKLSITYILQQMKDLLILSGVICKSVISEPFQQAIHPSRAWNYSGHLVSLTAHAFGWVALTEQLVANLWNARSHFKGKKKSQFRCRKMTVDLRMF